VPEEKKLSVLTDAFKDALENVAAKLKGRLNQNEKMGPMAFFFGSDGTMQTISFRIKDDFQKELLILRMREKVIAENICTVLVLTDTNEHCVTILGASDIARVSARIDFDLDESTGDPAEWRITWLNNPVQNILLDRVFDGDISAKQR
jgi:hypothetical protein